MPGSSSYIQNNDYRVFDVKPFKLPINDIAKTIAVKTQFWNEGASKVKAIYDSALDLSLTNEENKQIKKDYLQKSQEMIKQLSSQDLGNPDIQQTGVGIFKNLFADEGILYDDQYTKHLKKVNNDYASLLKSDPAKASTINLGYAMEDAVAFKNDPDRNSAKKYYERRREYTPYYDPMNDIESVMKYCHASSTSQESPLQGTGYSYATTDKGLSSPQVVQCFNAGLSQQARAQMNINGYMMFKNHKEALGDLYSNYLNTSTLQIQSDKDKTDAKVAVLFKKNRLGTATKEEIAALKNYTLQSKEYGSQIDNMTKVRESLLKKDYTPLDKDLENIAGLMFTNLKLSSFGKAFSYRDFSEKTIADPVGMLRIKQEFEARENYNQRVFDREENDATRANRIQVALIGLEGKGTGTSGKDIKTLGDQLAHNPNIDADSEFTLTDFNSYKQDLANADAGLHENNERLKATLLKDPEFLNAFKDRVVGTASGKPMLLKDLSPDEFASNLTVQKYVNEAKQNVNSYIGIADWVAKNDQLKMIKDLNIATNNKLWLQISPELRNFSSNIDKEIASLPNSKRVRYLYDAIKENRTGLNDDNPRQGIIVKDASGNTTDYITLEDKNYKIAVGLYNKNQENIRKLDEAITKVYHNENYQFKHMFEINPDSDAAKHLSTKLDDMMGILGIKEGRSILRSYDAMNGDVLIKLPKGIKSTDILDATGAADIKDLKNGSYLLKSVPSFDKSKDGGMSPETLQLGTLLKTNSETGINSKRPGDVLTEVPFTRKIKNTIKTYKIVSTLYAAGDVRYHIEDENGDVLERTMTSDPYAVAGLSKLNLQ